jgi:hypothetical protein
MPPLPEPIAHTTDAIYRAIAAKARGGDSRGVPMSNAANECERAIWYSLRWSHEPEKIDGEKQSRFDTGNYWEARLLDDLEAAGFDVQRLDLATGQQFKVELADGWLRGRMDGTVLGLPEAPKTLHVVECKSHKERSFKELQKHKKPAGEGIKKSKPDHYAQCQNYMAAFGLTRCLYLAVNKNDDVRYAERIEYDAGFALTLEAKVSRIVASDRAPAKLHDDPKAKGAFACSWCPALAQCHEGAWARRNCRTCLSSSFESGANVRCTLKDKTLTYDEQQAGCGEHRFLPSLVPAIEQIDADPARRTITYKLQDGTVWTDGGAQ